MTRSLGSLVEAFFDLQDEMEVYLHREFTRTIEDARVVMLRLTDLYRSAKEGVGPD